MIATNAGGIHVVRYGTMRAQVAGIEAVLGDGSVVSHLAGLAKDNTGYDLAGLLTGSEGTLAVITAARLRLVPRLEHRVTAGLGLAGVAEAVAAVAWLRERLAGLEAVELMLADGSPARRRPARLAAAEPRSGRRRRSSWRSVATTTPWRSWPPRSPSSTWSASRWSP